MASMKAQIIQAVEQMDDDTTFFVWDMLTRHFNTQHKKISWGDIEEIEPDNTDLEMIRKMETDPDCRIYISREELIARRKSR